MQCEAEEVATATQMTDRCQLWRDSHRTYPVADEALAVPLCLTWKPARGSDIWGAPPSRDGNNPLSGPPYSACRHVQQRYPCRVAGACESECLKPGV